MIDLLNVDAPTARAPQADRAPTVADGPRFRDALERRERIGTEPATESSRPEPATRNERAERTERDQDVGESQRTPPADHAPKSDRTSEAGNTETPGDSTSTAADGVVPSTEVVSVDEGVVIDVDPTVVAEELLVPTDATTPAVQDARPPVVEGAPPAGFQPFGRIEETGPTDGGETTDDQNSNGPPRPPKSLFAPSGIATSEPTDDTPPGVPEDVEQSPHSEPHGTTGETSPAHDVVRRISSTPSPADPVNVTSETEATRRNERSTKGDDGRTTTQVATFTAGTGAIESAAVIAVATVSGGAGNDASAERRDANGETLAPIDEASPTTISRSGDPVGTSATARGTSKEAVTTTGTERGANHAAGPSTADLENAEAVMRGVQRSLTTGRTLRMRLDPPELGSLTIEIVRRDGAFVARLEVDNVAAQRMMQEHAAALGDQLAKLGHTLDRIEVELGDTGEDDGTGEEQRGRDEQGRGHGEREAGEDQRREASRSRDRGEDSEDVDVTI